MGRAQHRGQEVHHQREAQFRLRRLQAVLDKEHEQHGRQGVGEAVEQVGDEQAAKRPVLRQQAHAIAQIQTGVAVTLAFRFADADQQHQQAQRQGHQQGRTR